MAIWSTHRNPALCALGGLALGALTAAAMYAAGVLFLMANQADPAQAGITSIFDYWRWYADEPQQHVRLVSATVRSAGAVLVVLQVAWAASFVPWRRLLELLRRQRVAARFASVAEIRRAGLLDHGGDPRLVVGTHRANCLSLPGGQPVMLFGPPRSDKGVGMVIPNLLCWADSVVVLDIDGRYFDVTAGFRAGGQPVFTFSPFDEQARSHCWNPLSAVRDDKEHREADLRVIAQAFFPSVGQESSDAFYYKIARSLFVKLGLILFESPELPRTIGEMLRQASRLRSLMLWMARQRREDGRSLSPEEADILATDFDNPQGIWSHVVATFKEALCIFGEMSVDAATSGDDFRLEDVRRRRMSIYVRVPAGRLGSAKPLLNLFFSQLVALNTRQAPVQDPALKYQCLVVNQASTALGRVESIASKAAVFGDYNLTLLTVAQSMSELSAMYGWEEARRFAANHAVRIFYATLLRGDAHEYSAMLGCRSQKAMPLGLARCASRHLRSFFLRDERRPRRPLLFPQEFKELGSELLVLVTQNCRPVLARKIRYHIDADLNQRLRPPPMVPRLDMQRHMVRVRRRKSDVREPVDEHCPAGKTSGSPLVRDLAALSARLEKSHEKAAQDIRTDHRFAEDEGITRH